MHFTKIKFLVQIHDLPMRMIDPETAIELRESLGEVSPVENSREMVGVILFGLRWR